MPVPMYRTVDFALSCAVGRVVVVGPHHSKPRRDMLFLLAPLLAPGSVHLPDGTPTVSFGVGNQARLQASCSLATPMLVAISPQTVNSLEETALKVYINGMPRCADVLSLRTPCVPHTTDLPALFWCTWRGKGDDAPASTGPIRATFEAVSDPGESSITASLQGTAECPLPAFGSVTRLLGGVRDGHLNVSISYYQPVDQPLAVSLPFGGAVGGESVAFVGLIAPPPPHPPSPPPPPNVPPAEWMYTFDDASSPYENLGTSGSQMDLSVATVGRTTDSKAGAGALDMCASGCGGWLKLPWPSAASSAASFTLAYFIKVRSWSNSPHPYLADWRDDTESFGSGNGGYWHATTSSGTLCYGTSSADNPTQQCGSNPIATGAWHHVCLVSDSSSGKSTFYYDGEVATTYPHDMRAAGTMTFGNRFTGEYPLNGIIDNLYLAMKAATHKSCQELAAGAIPL